MFLQTFYLKRKLNDVRSRLISSAYQHIMIQIICMSLAISIATTHRHKAHIAAAVKISSKIDSRNMELLLFINQNDSWIDDVRLNKWSERSFEWKL